MRIPSPRTLRIVWFSEFLFACLITSLGFAQFGFSQSGPQIFHPTPRGLRQTLNRAQRAIAEQRFTDAVNELGGILIGKAEGDTNSADVVSEDYFIESPGGGGLSSLRTEVLRLIGNLPDAGREIYELQFGSDARALLNEAVTQGELEKLAEVIRKYFHTAAGYEASIILARCQLNQGQPLAAAVTLRRIGQSPRALKALDPELSILLAASWQCAGDEQKARSTMEELRVRAPSAAIQLAGQRVLLFKQPNQAMEILKGVIGNANWATDERMKQWTMFRGNVARNGKGVGSGPLQYPRWRATIINDFGDEQVVQGIHKRELEANRPLIPSLQPLAVDDTILMRTPDEIVGIDFSSGKIVWVYPWSQEHEAATTLRNSAPNMALQNREVELAQRLWGDWAYGEISSDGRSVYMLDKMGVAAGQRGGRQQFVGPGGMVRLNPNFPTSFNQLVALDLTRQGALRWIVGDETGWDEPKLANHFFLGPPLPLSDRLYVLAEANGEIRLHCLKSATGSSDWSQQIAHVETRPILIDATRRLAGSTPSYSDGILLCPTSAGALVAIDLATRSFLWAYTYSASSGTERLVPEDQPGFQRNTVAGTRWLDATVSAADGRVLLTPIDSNDLHCVDLLTGRAAWPPRRREQNLKDMLYVGCIHRGNAVLVGTRSLVSIRLADGREYWGSPIDLNTDPPEQVSGRGILANEFYYVPTTAAQILKIDLEAGKIVERIPTSGILGNLVAYRNEIVSLGMNHLSVHYQIEPLRERVASIIKQSPNDPWALTRQGELFLHDRQPRQAFESLLKARENNPADDTISSLLVDSFLASLEQDFVKTRSFVSRIEPLISQAEHQAKFLKLFVAGAQLSGDQLQAFEACLKLADLSLDPAWMGADSLEEMQPGWKVHRDTWVQNRVARLLGSGDSGQRQAMDRLLEERLERAVSSLSPNLLRQFVVHFDSHPSSKSARLKLAERLLQSEDWLEGDINLVPLLNDADANIAAAATALRISLLSATKNYQKAAVECQRLLKNWPDIQLTPNVIVHDKSDAKAKVASTSQSKPDEQARERVTGRQHVESICENSAIADHMKPVDPWPNGRVIVKDLPNEAANFSRQQIQLPWSIPVRESSGRFADAWIDFESSQNLVNLRDGNGRNVFGFNIPDPSSLTPINPAARTYGNVLLFMPRTQPLAIDLFQTDRGAEDAIIWPKPQQDFTYAGQPFSTSQTNSATSNKLESPQDVNWGLGALGPMTRHGVIWLRRGLHCVNPISGVARWSRLNVPASADLLGDEDYVVVVDRKASDPLIQDNEVVVYRTMDGTEVSRFRLPEHGSCWSAAGRNLLLWRDTPTGGTELRLWDAVRNAEIWSESFQDGAKGTIVAGEEVLVCQKDGRLVIRSLFDDAHRLETNVEPEAKLTGVYAMRSHEAYYFTVARAVAGAAARPMARSWPIVCGSLYRLNRQTQELDWPSPATIDGAILMLELPTNSPSIVFFGNDGIGAQATTMRTNTQSVMCVDKQTGRAIFSRRQIPQATASRGPQLAVDPQNKTLQLAIGSQSFEMTFTSEPRPPEPPVQDWSVSNRTR